jgi:hypothetical protein
MLANIDFTDKWRTKPAQPHQHISHVIPQILSILSNEDRSIYHGEEGGFCLIFICEIGIS